MIDYHGGEKGSEKTDRLGGETTKWGHTGASKVQFAQSPKKKEVALGGGGEGGVVRKAETSVEGGKKKKKNARRSIGLGEAGGDEGEKKGGRKKPRARGDGFLALSKKGSEKKEEEQGKSGPGTQGPAPQAEVPASAYRLDIRTRGKGSSR